MDRAKLMEARAWLLKELVTCANFWLKNGIDPVHGGVPKNLKYKSESFDLQRPWGLYQGAQLFKGWVNLQDALSLKQRIQKDPSLQSSDLYSDTDFLRGLGPDVEPPMVLLLLICEMDMKILSFKVTQWELNNILKAFERVK